MLYCTSLWLNLFILPKSEIIKDTQIGQVKVKALSQDEVFATTTHSLHKFTFHLVCNKIDKKYKVE